MTFTDDFLEEFDDNNYWRQRQLESEVIKSDLKADKAYNKKLKKLYKQTMADIDAEIARDIHGFADSEVMSIEYAKQTIKDTDVERIRGAIDATVKSAGREAALGMVDPSVLKKYNVTMRTSRLEALKAKTYLNLIQLGNKEVTATRKHLITEGINRYLKQVGILGMTIPDNKSLENAAKRYAEAEFRNVKFSDRIWQNQEELGTEIDRIIRRTVMQGENPQKGLARIRKLVREEFDKKTYAAQRIAITETARVQGEMSRQAFADNGYNMFRISIEPTACDQCKQAQANGPYQLDDFQVGQNAVPFHPFCRCAISPYMDREMVEKRLKEIEQTHRESIYKNLRGEGQGKIYEYVRTLKEGLSKKYQDELGYYGDKGMEMRQHIRQYLFDSLPDEYNDEEYRSFLQESIDNLFGAINNSELDEPIRGYAVMDANDVRGLKARMEAGVKSMQPGDFLEVSLDPESEGLMDFLDEHGDGLELIQVDMSEGLNAAPFKSNYYSDGDEFFRHLLLKPDTELELIRIKDITLDGKTYQVLQVRANPTTAAGQMTFNNYREYVGEKIVRTIENYGKNLENYQNEIPERFLDMYDPDDHLEDVKEIFADVLSEEKASLRMRVPDDPDAVENILHERFKNQMETDRSQGSYIPDKRMEASNNMFGTDLNEVMPEDFEKYGYVGPKDFREEILYEEAERKHGGFFGSSGVSNYGDIVYEFKPSVRARATFTTNDSLGAALDRRTIPKPIDSPDYFLMDEVKILVRRLNADSQYPGADNVYDLVKQLRTRYIEAQYHGELTVDDVDTVYFPEDRFVEDFVIDGYVDRGVNVMIYSPDGTVREY